VLHHARNLQPAGIRSNIDRRIRLHFLGGASGFLVGMVL